MTSSTTEEKKLAIMQFAMIPFAVISFISSSYSIYHILRSRQEKLKRMYHRLVLAMHLALLPLSVAWVLGPFAVPEGTPYYPVASGTIQTCTAQGFLFLLFSLAVPTYYASLILQAFLGIKHNFKEGEYRWIEKWIHIAAYCIPLALACVFAATENFNPTGSGCYVNRSPNGCEADPNVACQRGKYMKGFECTLFFLVCFIYLIFPPSVIAAMYCWINRAGKNLERSTGWQRLKESARKEMLSSVAKQLSFYLFSFWLTWIPSCIAVAYRVLTRDYLYDLAIFANCMHSFQGFVFTMVYFVLQRQGNQKVDVLSQAQVSQSKPKSKHAITVVDIRENAQRSLQNLSETTPDAGERISFNIFDGTPDKNSPWARFIDEDYEDEEHNVHAPDEGMVIPSNHHQ